MKKTKFLLLIATLLAVATIFCSCGTVSSVNKFLNKDYDPLEDVYTDQSTISDLAGYTLIKDNEDFAVFRSTDPLNPIYKVYSFNAGQIIATLADQTSIFAFNIFDDAPIIIVAKATKPASEDTTPKEAASDIIDGIVDGITGNPEETPGDIVDGVENAIDNLADVTYTAYDADGNIIKTTSYKPENPYIINYDTCVFDYAVYSVDTEGALTKTADIPEYVLLNNDIAHINEDYYYTFNKNTVTVYDHSFNVVSYWSAPSYANNDLRTHVMNNGNILVQYTYEVDEDQKKYDLSDFQGKYTAKLDLVSLIIDASNGSAKEINLDYIVRECYTNSEINSYYNYLEEVSPFTDNFENVAIIAPIVDKKIDDSQASLDIVFMNNKGKAQDSLKIVDNQRASIFAISKIGDDLYIADTLTGSALINAKGKVLKNMNSSLEVCGSYFVGERAIYDLNLEIVYNLVENDAEVIDLIDNTVFVKVKNDNGYSIISFLGGEQNTIYTYNKNASSTTSFDLVDEIGYVIVDSKTKDHKYYNSEGTLLVTTTYALEEVASSDRHDTVIMKGLSGGTTVYHKICINK